MLTEELLNLKDEIKAKNLSRFFKTKKGQYSYHDKFLGINVPRLRKFSEKYYNKVDFDYISEMLDNEYHEIRLCALLIMVLIYEKTSFKKEILNLYLNNIKNINNWDLVDLTAHKIIGADYIQTKNPEIIRKLANSSDLWAQRIAIVSQLSVVKEGDFKLLIELCEKFLYTKYDLIQKATGWLLREAGKKIKKFCWIF